MLNRTRRDGIIAPGAALSRAGENGKGVTSRWYPETIVDRSREIAEYAVRIDFRETDGIGLLEELLERGGTETECPSGPVVFVDPPYTAGGKRAGRRLYAHNEIDHRRLFELLADSGVRFLMTYDRSSRIVALSRKYRFHALQVTMKNTHHTRIPELIITPEPVFVR